MTQTLKNFDGEPLKDGKENEIILRTIFTDALLTVTKTSQNETGSLKYKRYKLAGIINSSDTPDLNVDDVKKLKDYVGEMYTPMVVGIVWDIINKLTEVQE